MKSLHLAMNGVGVPGAMFAGDMLQTNETLTYLDVSFNRIHDQGVEFTWLADSLPFVARKDAGLTEAGLMERCREALAGYKRPREIRFIELDDFPRSTSGKIQRHALEARLASEEPNTTA